MSAEIVDGKSMAKQVQKHLAERVGGITPRLGRSPGLAVVLVGEDPASKVYVASKTKKARKCGIEVEDHYLPTDTDDNSLQKLLSELSQKDTVDGILLQLPLPKHLDEFAALNCISPDKDVDGLHPVNQGLLLRGAPAHRPCTPLGCIYLIEQALKQLGREKDMSGLHAVVVGRSILVGKPIAFLLLEKNCTVTICHSRTVDIPAECKKADILIAAVGREKLIKASDVKEGAIVIDVGINRTEEGKLCGDVDYESVKEVAAAVTPVPGGVGPMTIAMLLSNTVDSAESKCQ